MFCNDSAILNKRWSLLRELSQRWSNQLSVHADDHVVMNFLKRKARIDDVRFFSGLMNSEVRFPQTEVRTLLSKILSNSFFCLF